MNSPNRHRFTVKAAVIVLLISVASLLMIAGRATSRATVQGRSITTQSLFFPYWSVRDGFDSTVGFNNASNLQLTVHPTLYNASGKSLSVSPIVLGPRQQFMANIADWIAQSGGDATFAHGSLSLSYEAPGTAYLGSQLTITNPASSLVFDISDEDPASYASSRLEGLWWRHDNASQYNLILTNTTDNSVDVEASFTVEQKPSADTLLKLSLEPHQTQALNLKDVKLPISNGNGTGKMGGISIAHTGRPGAVLAYGMLTKSQVGFSSSFSFLDPAASQSQNLAAAHMLIEKPDINGFSPNASFTSIALLRNASDVPIEVKPTVSFTSNKEPQTATLPIRELLPQQIEAMDIGAELKRAGFRGPFVGVGLTLTSTGKPGALVGHLTSFDQTRNQVFDVPLKDSAVRSNRYGGCYPWMIGGDTQSIIHIRNTADKKSLLNIQLDWEGGSYALPVQELEPQQEVAIDIRRLRDKQEKDSIGRVIPLEVAGGQATWYERGDEALIGRMEVFSTSAATTSSFSCEVPNCCLPSTFVVFCVPVEMFGLVGETSLTQLFERTYRDCDGAFFGPFNVTTQASWSSNNTAVVRVDGVSLSGCRTTCVGVGQATLNASYNEVEWEFFYRENRCRRRIIPVIIPCPIQVNQPELRGSIPQPLVSGDLDSTISGQPFTFQVEAVNPRTGARATTVNGQATLNFPVPGLVQGESVSPNPVTINQGVGQTRVVLRIVDTGPSFGRSYTLSATGATPGGGLVKVWFRVEMDVERWKNCGFQSCPNLGSYFCTTACVTGGFPQPTSFVALTDRVCNSSVTIKNTANGATQSAPVQDVGPVTNNPYWNTGTIPSTAGCITDVLADSLGVPNGCNPGPFGRATVLWRFQ